MQQIGKTVILDETEEVHKCCPIDIINKAHNIISIHRTTGEIKFLKTKYLEVMKSNLFKSK